MHQWLIDLTDDVDLQDSFKIPTGAGDCAFAAGRFFFLPADVVKITCSEGLA